MSAARVLIVDDEKSMRDLLTITLESQSDHFTLIQLLHWGFIVEAAALHDHNSEMRT